MAFIKTTPQKLKRALRSRGLTGLALDIDDTLSHTDRHFFDTMLAFANPEKLTRNQIIKKYGRIKNVRYWQSKEAIRFINTLLRSDDFSLQIPLIEESGPAVRKIHKIIPIVAYITGRPVVTHEGTRQWLKQHNFPDAPIILSPRVAGGSKRNLWKAKILHGLYPEVLGIVDDHPKLNRALKKMKYKGTLFLYDSGRNTKKYHHKLILFRNWSTIVKKVAALKRRLV